MKTSINNNKNQNINNKFQQFGKLTSFRSMQEYFQKCRFQSRQHLIKRLQNHHGNNHDRLNSNKKQQMLAKLNTSGSVSLINNNSAIKTQSTTLFNTINSTARKEFNHIGSNINVNVNNNYTNFNNNTNNSTFKATPRALTPSTLQQSISTTFHQLVQWSDYDPNNSIVKEISRLFSLNLDYLVGKSKEEKRMYIMEKIHEEVEKNVMQGLGSGANETSTVGGGSQFDGSGSNNIINSQEDNTSSKHDQKAFQWLGVNTAYSALKPIFEQILIERVKLFDNQLSQLASTTQHNFTSVQELVTTARTIDNTLHHNFENTDKKSLFNKRNYNSLTNLSKRKQLKSHLNDPFKGFCNVKIRDESTFSLDKWTKKEEKQFQTKRAQYKARQSKIQNNPILFQFVKKYTKTVKARQNIYQKWENREKTQITSEELKYLCATSLFLNQTLNKSQKQRYRKNIQTAGKKLISRLEFNIAEHIIETYKTFMKKVFDLRAQYYEDLTAKRKRQYTLTKKKEEINEKAYIRITALKKSIKMFTTIVNSEKMQLHMNAKILRWVVLFCQKLKKKAKINDKKIQKSKSLAFVKRLDSKKVQPFLMALKKAAPVAKILKRQNHDNYRAQTKKYVQTQRFYYQDTFEETINKFNRIKSVKTQSSVHSYRKHLSGGPRSENKKIVVNLSKKTVHMESKKCLSYIIKIQSIWRKHYYRKIYLKMRDQKRKRQQDDFERKYGRLWRIYPINKKINFEQIKNRLKRFSMRINNLAKPYVRTYRKPINTYTSFSKYNISLPELKLKHSKMSARRLSEFVHLVEQDFYSSIIQNAYVITEKQINSPICKQGATILWWAVRNSNEQLVKKLLQGGGDPNSKNFQESSCLHQAMKKGDVQIIFLLLDYGADLNSKNNKKQTPLYFCSQKMLKLLGLEDGTSTVEDKLNQQQDNNRLFYRPQPQDIYIEHYY